jgi:hypothetical protein
MSHLYDRLAEVASTRLSVVANTAATLKAQLSELNELRDVIRKAELSVHHPRPRMENAARV